MTRTKIGSFGMRELRDGLHNSDGLMFPFSRELLNDFPIKLTPPQTIPEAKIQLTKYITEAKQIAE